MALILPKRVPAKYLEKTNNERMERNLAYSENLENKIMENTYHYGGTFVDAAAATPIPATLFLYLEDYPQNHETSTCYQNYFKILYRYQWLLNAQRLNAVEKMQNVNRTLSNVNTGDGHHKNALSKKKTIHWIHADYYPPIFLLNYGYLKDAHIDFLFWCSQENELSGFRTVKDHPDIGIAEHYEMLNDDDECLSDRNSSIQLTSSSRSLECRRKRESKISLILNSIIDRPTTLPNDMDLVFHRPDSNPITSSHLESSSKNLELCIANSSCGEEHFTRQKNGSASGKLPSMFMIFRPTIVLLCILLLPISIAAPINDRDADFKFQSEMYTASDWNGIRCGFSSSKITIIRTFNGSPQRVEKQKWMKMQRLENGCVNVTIENVKDHAGLFVFYVQSVPMGSLILHYVEPTLSSPVDTMNETFITSSVQSENDSAITSSSSVNNGYAANDTGRHITIAVVLIILAILLVIALLVMAVCNYLGDKKKKRSKQDIEVAAEQELLETGSEREQRTGNPDDVASRANE